MKAAPGITESDKPRFARARKRTANVESTTHIRGVRIDRCTATFVGLVVAVLYWPSAFGIWRSYDDEGAMLVLYRSFSENGGLYRTTYSNYGPFPFALWWVLLRPFGFDFDSLFVGRFLALVLLSASAVVATRIARQFAGRVTSVVVGLVVADLLTVNFNEPLHPGAVIGFLLLIAVWSQLLVRDERKQQAVLGIVCSALLFSKINLGVFAIIAWAVTFVYSRFDASIRSTRIAQRATAGLLTAFPLMLVLSGSTQWRTVFMAMSMACTLALTSFAWFSRTPAPSRPWTTLRSPFAAATWFFGGGLLVAVFSLGVVVLRGSDPSGIVSGMVGRALRQRGVFTLYVFADPLRVVLLGLTAAVTLVCLVRARRSVRRSVEEVRWELGLVVFVELIAGGELLLVPSYGLSLLPVVALLVVPTMGRSVNGDRSKQLLFVVLLGVLQILHAYPVAGSQMGWAMLVVTLLGGLVFAQGANDAKRLAQKVSVTPLMLKASSMAFAAVAGVSVLGFMQASSSQWRLYGSNVPLNVQHAPFVRLPASQVTTLASVANAIRTECTGYYSLPGMGTFSVLTRLKLATGFNATVWPLLFDEADQRHVIADLRRVERLCVIRNETVLQGWMQGRRVPDGPLLDYLATFNRLVLNAGDYSVWVGP